MGAAELRGDVRPPRPALNLYVRDVLQKAMLAMEESGVEAAAASAVILNLHVIHHRVQRASRWWSIGPSSSRSSTAPGRSSSWGTSRIRPTPAAKPGRESVDGRSARPATRENENETITRTSTITRQEAPSRSRPAVHDHENEHDHDPPWQCDHDRTRVERRRGAVGLGSRGSRPLSRLRRCLNPGRGPSPAPALHTGHGDFRHPALPAESVSRSIRVAGWARCAGAPDSRGRDPTPQARFPRPLHVGQPRPPRRLGRCRLASSGVSSRPASRRSRQVARPAFAGRYSRPILGRAVDAMCRTTSTTGQCTMLPAFSPEHRRFGPLLLLWSREDHLLSRRPRRRRDGRCSRGSRRPRRRRKSTTCDLSSLMIRSRGGESLPSSSRSRCSTFGAQCDAAGCELTNTVQVVCRSRVAHFRSRPLTCGALRLFEQRRSPS